MHRERLVLLLEALRSNEYKKTENYGYDRDEIGYSAAGVAGDVAMKNGLNSIEWYKSGFFTDAIYNKSMGSPFGAHDIIAAWYGIPYVRWDEPGPYDWSNITRMNDRGSSFEQIADYIEKEMLS